MRYLVTGIIMLISTQIVIGQDIKQDEFDYGLLSMSSSLLF
jgi:hypothetical protein